MKGAKGLHVLQDAYIVVRRLGISDLGLFAAPRVRLAGKQRALNINSAVVAKLLPTAKIVSGHADVRCVCLEGAAQTEVRPLSKVHKNWRLGGPKIIDPFYDFIAEGDLFIGIWAAKTSDNPILQWRVIMAAQDSALHAQVSTYFETLAQNSMVLADAGTKPFEHFVRLLGGEPTSEQQPAGLFPDPPTIAACTGRGLDGIRPRRSSAPRAPSPKRPSSSTSPPRVRDKLRSPHILAEMLRVSAELSAPAQAEFLELFAMHAEDLRQILMQAGAIQRVERDHSTVWKEAKGQLIASVDAGMAGMSALGSAPMAIRAGAYLVRPGVRGPEREDFRMVRQLVGETYEIFDGGFPDNGALRDAARISLETAAALKVALDCRDLGLLILHGALVNPVSRYTDDLESGAVFPSFRAETLRLLLPEEDPPATGREANFIATHLRQLQQLATSPALVCSVVERESASRSVAAGLIEEVIQDEHVLAVMGDNKETWRKRIERGFLNPYRVADTLLFRCVLNPGEYLLPVPVDRNNPAKAPRPWIEEVAAYPKPQVSYFLPSARMAPVRFEIFEKDLPRFSELARFLMHCAWLLPGYAFPVSLDTVDRFAKIPAWMTRSVQERGAVEVLRRAIETKQPEVIAAARKLLTGGVRDWLFRPGV